MALGEIDMVREVADFLSMSSKEKALKESLSSTLTILKCDSPTIPGEITRAAAPMPVSRFCVSGHYCLSRGRAAFSL